MNKIGLMTDNSFFYNKKIKCNKNNCAKEVTINVQQNIFFAEWIRIDKTTTVLQNREQNKIHTITQNQHSNKPIELNNRQDKLIWFTWAADII